MGEDIKPSGVDRRHRCFALSFVEFEYLLTSLIERDIFSAGDYDRGRVDLGKVVSHFKHLVLLLLLF